MTVKMKAIISLLAVLYVFGFITACNQDSEDNNNVYSSNIFNVVKVTPGDLLAPEYGETDEAARTAAIGANDFAFRLSAILVEKAKNENFIFSPYSVWMPLAALVNAADDQSKAGLLTALGASGISEADINRAASRMLYDLTKMRNRDYDEYYNPLKITNAIFVGNNVTLRKSFAQTFMDYFRGNSINVDFSSRDAVDAVNQWASESTNGLITNVVQQFDPLTVAAIANAIYFSDGWQREFNSDITKEDVFYSAAGESSAFYMRREGDGQIYYEDDKIQALPLWFKTGGYMLIMLPKPGNDAAELLASMSNDYFNEIQNKLSEASGTLLLPRFSIENDINGLKNALEALGVPLFDEITAPLTKGIIEEDIPVFLTDAMQKALIKVDEKGTTAAAVTVLLAGTTSMPQPTIPFEMICNRPFVFILCEHTHDGGSQILFTGVVNRP